MSDKIGMVIHPVTEGAILALKDTVLEIINARADQATIQMALGLLKEATSRPIRISDVTITVSDSEVDCDG